LTFAKLALATPKQSVYLLLLHSTLSTYTSQYHLSRMIPAGLLAAIDWIRRPAPLVGLVCGRAPDHSDWLQPPELPAGPPEFGVNLFSRCKSLQYTKMKLGTISTHNGTAFTHNLHTTQAKTKQRKSSAGKGRKKAGIH
jgi:hypothetical protein